MGRFLRNLRFAMVLGLGIWLVNLPALAQDAEREERFFTANQAYKEGRFQQAADAYDQLIESGIVNGHVYYNLGNACFRMNALGRAILNYERARLFMPRDADLNFNLRQVRTQLKDDIPEARGFINQTFFWLEDVTLKELLAVFAALNLLFWGVLLVRVFRKPEWTFYAFIVLIIFWGIAGISFGLKWVQLETDDRALVLKKEISVMAGPDTRDTVLFKLHEGTMVAQERSEDGWALIRLPDKKRGWVIADGVEKIM
ncbi:MAG: SH3 domain-containing protein [Pseudomonadota bacterium]